MSSPAENPSQRARYRFSLAQLFALLAALSLLLGMLRLLFPEEFGLWALLFILIGFGSALAVLATAQSTKLPHALVVLCIFGFLTALFLPAVHSSGRGRRPGCYNNLRQISAALIVYESAYGSLPPPYIADAQGNPMHSWRVLILPFLGEQELHDQYRFDEPWDGPNNKKLHDRIVAVFRCPQDHPSRRSGAARDTSYVVITGPGTAFPGGLRKMSLADIAAGDGTSNTIFVAEVADSGIHWLEPRDLDLATVDFQVNGKAAASISSKHTGGAMVVMVDGGVRYLDERTPPQVVKQLITIKDGQPLPENLGVPAE